MIQIRFGCLNLSEFFPISAKIQTSNNLMIQTNSEWIQKMIQTDSDMIQMSFKRNSDKIQTRFSKIQILNLV